MEHDVSLLGYHVDLAGGGHGAQDVTQFEGVGEWPVQHRDVGRQAHDVHGHVGSCVGVVARQPALVLAVPHQTGHVDGRGADAGGDVEQHADHFGTRREVERLVCRIEFADLVGPGGPQRQIQLAGACRHRHERVVGDRCAQGLAIGELEVGLAFVGLGDPGGIRDAVGPERGHERPQAVEVTNFHLGLSQCCPRDARCCKPGHQCPPRHVALLDGDADTKHRAGGDGKRFMRWRAPGVATVTTGRHVGDKPWRACRRPR
nr:hypothetical protein [Luteitalea sp. TBR-22]